MDSLFFNLNDTKYKKSSAGCGITRVDILQGLLYLDAKTLKKEATFKIDSVDKMAMVFVVKSGSMALKSDENVRQLNKEIIYIYSLKGQKIEITFNVKSEVFVLFIADFFLKNYMDNNSNNPVNLLYDTVQNSLGLEELCSCSLDEISSYLVQNILNIDDNINLLSLKAEALSLELVIHFLQILKFNLDGFKPQELELANRAKELLLKDFVNPPTIKKLAKLCQTNETKLKKVFKKVCNSTIYSFIQDSRLKRAYYLLKDGGYTVGEASKAVGYAHQGNFAKLFKEKYKVEPSLINKILFVAN